MSLFQIDKLSEKLRRDGFLVRFDLHYLLLSETRSTVKPVYNDHPQDPKKVVVVDRWSLLRGHLCYKTSNWDLKMWPLLTCGRYSEVVDHGR